MIYLLYLMIVISGCYGADIRCTKKSEVCYKNYTISKFKKERQDVAPVPESLDVKVNGHKLAITWTQKRSHLQYVEAYWVTITVFTEGQDNAFSINSSLILEKLPSNETMVSFRYDEAQYLDCPMVVTLYALPVYNENDKDQYIQKMIEPAKRIYQPQPMEMPDLSPSTYYSGETPKPEIIQQKSTTAVESGDCTFPITVTVVTSNFITVSIMLIILTMRYKYRTRKRRRSSSESHDFMIKATQPGDLGIQQRRTVLVLTNSDESDEEYSERDYFKRIALCLANALQSSHEFDVSCNLWMSEYISERGIAVWAHDVMKSNHKVIILCNSNELTTANPNSHQPPNAYTKLIRNLFNSAYFEHSKFVIVCMDESTPHTCFGGMNIQALEICKHCKIRPNLNELLSILRPEGLDREKIDPMNQIFSQMIGRLQNSQRSRHHSQGFQRQCPFYTTINENDVISKNVTCPDKYPCKKHKELYKKRSRGTSESSKSDGWTESQHDSLYSSRCNSQSSETVSSGEDTGYLDRCHGPKTPLNPSNQLQTGTKSKIKPSS